MAKKTGRPAGVMLHAEAFEALVAARGHLKKDIAADAQASPSFLADLLAHRVGAGPEMVERISSSLGVTPAAIFPELAVNPWTSPIPDREAKRRKAAA